jgi:DNA-binding transcriptional LysR family regulator
MDLRQLSYFVAVAEDGQFTRAANRVSVAQPAVSAQIRRLERELGEALFHRDRRAVTLTAAGEALLPHARDALDAAERGRDTIASLRGVLHGRLTIGVAGPVGHRLAQALGDFHRAHPAIEIALANHHNEPLLAAVADGEVDVGVVGVGAQPTPPSVRTRIVSLEPLVAGIEAGHPLAGRRTIAVGELRDTPLVTLMRGSGLRAVLENACRSAGFDPRIAAEAGDLGSVVALAAEGLGIAVVPRSAIDRAGLAIVPIARPRLERRTALAWSAAGISPAARAFLALAEGTLPGLIVRRRLPRR